MLWIRDLSSVGESLNEPLISIFDGEFISAGKNLDTILSNKVNWDYFYGQTFLWDIPRSIIPARFYYYQNSVGWFADQFHAARLRVGQGVGFSLAAEGFINFGYVGVILIFFVFAGLLSFLYNRSHRSFNSFIIYVLVAGFFIFTIRADLSNLFSPLFKQIFLPLLALAGVSSLLRKKGQITKHNYSAVMKQNAL